MRSPLPASRLATLLLVSVTAVWGSTFFLIRDLVAHVPSADFLAVRFAIAAVVMAMVFRRQTLALTRREVVVGVGLGVLYGLAQLLQTIGLEHTNASVSGFVTGTYVVLTPVLGAVLLRDRVPFTTWLAVGLATTGLAVLSLRGLSIGIGEALTLVAAGLYALHIIGLGRYSTAASANGLATVQAFVITAVTAVAAIPGGITLPSTGGQWASLLYMALMAGAVALWAQTWAQSHLPATRAAIVMTMEPVFAAFFAVLFGGESLTARMVVGGALVLTAMYVVELLGRRSGASAEQDRPAELLHHEV
ncbi:DMT family transporter [Nostocoides sp. HKS02]|uniref:DMT family transporter n=1 Tax=Nostocoides sp. HKS02 TaxID=1813880 RepID=UPI0012B46E2E|nr:DMT family transporter [Tetrasphaera sp. HKS02]QGN57554.1 EamA family transporter [Tetrasphaera sp. HKS02]